MGGQYRFQTDEVKEQDGKSRRASSHNTAASPIPSCKENAPYRHVSMRPIKFIGSFPIADAASGAEGVQDRVSVRRALYLMGGP